MPRDCKIVILYIKIHNITGLKYFGKTVKEDVYRYQGSGTVWKRHIKKHGYNVTTKIYAQFDINDNNIEDVALDFSYENNIIVSKDWANLIPENGLDGGCIKVSEITKEKLRQYKGERSSFYGKKHSQKTKEKMSVSQKGKIISEETKETMRKPKNIKPTKEMNIANRIRNTGSKNANSSKWIMESPDGLIFEINGTLKLFCKTHNLGLSTLKRNINNYISYVTYRNKTPVRINTSGWKLTKEIK